MVSILHILFQNTKSGGNTHFPEASITVNTKSRHIIRKEKNRQLSLKSINIYHEHIPKSLNIL